MRICLIVLGITSEKMMSLGQLYHVKNMWSTIKDYVKNRSTDILLIIIGLLCHKDYCRNPLSNTNGLIDEQTLGEENLVFIKLKVLPRKVGDIGLFIKLVLKVLNEFF